MALQTRSTQFIFLGFLVLSLLFAPAALFAQKSIAPVDPDVGKTCDVDVQPVALRPGSPTLFVDFGMQTGDFKCDGAECTGALREIGTDTEVQIQMRRCEIGDHCVSTEATSANGSRVTLIHNYSQLDGALILQQEVHVSGTRGTTTLYSLRLADESGRVTSTSYTVDGKTVSEKNFKAAAREATLLGAPIGSAYAITKRMADELGFVIPAIEGSYLSCVKECVDDCGGTHNGGNCTTFKWTYPSTGVYLCVQACGVGCSLAHPWSLIGCCLAGL